MVKLQAIYVTQRKLRNVNQLTQMLKAIANEDILPQIRLAEFEDGTIHVEDGHHRCISYWLSGRKELLDHEYILIQKGLQDRVRFGKIADLWKRIETTKTTDVEQCGKNMACLCAETTNAETTKLEPIKT